MLVEVGIYYRASFPIKSRGQILSPLLGDKVDSGIGLSYRPARLHTIYLRSGSTILCQSRLYLPVRTKNLATGQLTFSSA
jgi:hypothetical protein